MRAQDCGIYILAAGRSERFGPRDKLTAPLGGKAILQHVIETAAALPFARLSGVVPQSSTARRRLLRAADLGVIENETPARGLGSSLALGAKDAQRQSLKAMLILLGDMPFVQPQDLQGILALLEHHDKVISYCNKIKLPPMAVRFNMFEPLAEIDPRQGAKVLFAGEDCARYVLSSAAARDIDRHADLRGL